MSAKRTIPLYETDLYFCDNTAQIDKLCKRMGDYYKTPIDASGCKGYTRTFGHNGRLVIAIWASCYVTLCHESVHAKNQIYDMTGARCDVQNDELEAWLVHHIFELGMSAYGDKIPMR